MSVQNILKNILPSFFILLLLSPYSEVLAECALVLTSPADGAVFTGTGNQITIYGYVKAEVDPGYGYIELTNNGQYVQRWEGTFTSANFVLESGAAVATLSEGENRIKVVGDAVGCPSPDYDSITIYYEPDAETGPDADLGHGPEKGDGPPDCQNFAGDPVNIASGNVTAQVTDFSSEVPGFHSALQLFFTRSYNSQSEYNGPLGHGWTHNYDLSVIPSEAGGLVGVRRGNGRVLYFQDAGSGIFTAPKGVDHQLTLVNQQYLFTTVDNIIYTFSGQGLLMSVADPHGNTLTMQYNSADFPERLTGISDALGRTLLLEYSYNSGLITKMTDPGGGEYLYSYGTTAEEQAKKNLVAVTYPTDGATEKISYEYNDSADEHNLTAVVDENGHRYTYSYDSEDRALSSADEGGSSIALDWSASDSIQVTNGRGYAMLYSQTTMDGIGYITEIAPAAESGGGCSSCGSTGNYVYDTQHRLLSVTDARGTTRSFTYDSRGNILTRTEAVGTAEERQTVYTPHAVFNKPEVITRQSVDTPAQSAITQISYNASTGVPLSITINGYSGGQAESRTVSFTEHTTHGQVKKIDGPRTDVTDQTLFEYYSDTDSNIFNRAMLHTVTDASGGVTEFADYNQFGQPGQITDANGVITQLAYDPRGRLTGRTVDGKLTSYLYDKTGNLTEIIPPGLKNRLLLTYTPADLLETLEDQLGNTLEFSYDSEGNLLSEEHHDPGGVLKRSLTYEYDAFNRLRKSINPDGTFILRETDDNGNLTALTDALGRTTAFLYDALNRLTQETRPDTGVAQFGYDRADNPAQTIDPENTITTYTHDDFSGLRNRASQDSGATSYDYDAAGNLTSRIDAEGTTVQYTYDALNRPLTVSFNPPDTAQNLTFTYDEAAALHGKGRLTSLSDAGGGISWQYNALGNVTRESRTTDGIAYHTVYAYNDRNEITGITYPTGTQVTVQRYDNGEVSGILIDGQTATQNVSYLPFGPEEDFVFGNTLLTVDRTYVADYFRLERINAQVLDYQYEYYADGSVKSIDGITEPEITRGRTEYVTVNGNNRLDYVTRLDSSVRSYVHDNSGRITSDGVYTYSYNPLGRLIKVEQGATTVAEYAYDPFVRRNKKTVSGTTTHFHYDLQGRLIAETSGDGTALRDYVYQNGNLVALKLHGTQAGVYYVISDHLGTPQQIVNSAGTVVWKAEFLP
ncbi:MAG: DUF6531 domain-containing protein, partial [Candidatus Electrothrix sp.]